MALGIVSGMDETEKVRENRLRLAARRQGIQLVKSRRRDERAFDYGTYMLMNPETNSVIYSGFQTGYGLSLDDVESAITPSWWKNDANPDK